jgi:CheY-specific phosphatase CheX
MRCSQSSANRFGSRMLGRAFGSSAAEVRDAVGELCNMIDGNFKAKISSLADTRVRAMRTVIKGDDHFMSTVEPSNGVTIALMFGSDPIWVSLNTHS